MIYIVEKEVHIQTARMEFYIEICRHTYTRQNISEYSCQKKKEENSYTSTGKEKVEIDRVVKRCVIFKNIILIS